MARHKDGVWQLPESNNMTYEAASLGVLMDIRDELKRMNSILHCPNFLEIPFILRGIRRKLPTKPRKGGQS